MCARSIFLSCLLALISNAAIAGPALLFDADNGKVLYAEDIDRKWHPASLTKIMTAYVVFEDIKAGKLNLKSVVTCSKKALDQQPSKLGLPVGTEISMDLALRALIVKSANDVAVMLAETVSGTEEKFVARMNATATRLGMTQSNFVNPNGLPASQQVTTARDLAILSQRIAKDFPEFAHYFTLPSFRLGKIRLRSHNSLLKTFNGADGLKTGFICDSGFNVVASATREGRRLMAIVLGEPSGATRNIRAASLLEHGFQTYGWKQLFNTASLSTLPVNQDVNAVRSVRKSVTAWACNPRPRKIRKKKRRKSTATKAKSAAKVSKAKKTQ
jgi:D-alanyl-D-alanine carboxypeptidase